MPDIVKTPVSTVASGFAQAPAVSEAPVAGAPVGEVPLTELIAAENARQRRARRRWWSAAILVPLAAIGLYLLLRPAPLPLESRFRIEAISRGDIVREVRATGTLQAVTTVQVGAEVSGRIAAVSVDYNTRVRMGDVLATFDPTLLRSQVKQAEAAVAQGEAALEQAISDRDHLARDIERSRMLFERNLLAGQAYDADTSNLRLARQRVETAKSQLQAQRAALDFANTNLRHGTIRSPIDGIIVARNVDSGQTVASAFQTPVLFSVAADLRKMQVIAAIDEADIGELQEGQEATFTVNAYLDRVFHGVVRQVRNAPTIVENVVTYGAVIEVDNSDLALKPGMTASVRVLTGHARNVVRAPASALTFTPPGERADSNTGLWQLRSGRFNRLLVRTGLSDGEYTELRSDALRPGDKVLVELTSDGKKAYAEDK